MKSAIAISEKRADAVAAELHPERLTSGHLLASNALWNILGTCAPMLVAVGLLPVLKHRLGTDRLGVLTLAWVVIGYFGLFDFGLSRAVNKIIAERLAQRRASEIAELIWTSVVAALGLGVLGGITLFVLTPLLVGHVIRPPASIYGETLGSFRWLAVGIPAVVVTTPLRGVLEALQRFRLATAIRVPMGVFTYLGAVLALPFSRSLALVMAILVLGRVVALVAHLWAVLAVWPQVRHAGFGVTAFRTLVRFGSWITVSNIVGPFMVSFDRFAISALISVSAVAYYAVPNEVVSRLLVFPVAVTGVLFPAFSVAAEYDRKRLEKIVGAGVRAIALPLFAVVLLVIAFAPELLRVWLGSDFAQSSTTILRCLAAGVFINSVAQVPFAVVQGAGRPEWTAKLHLVELPIYAAAFVALAQAYGLTGVAIAWLARVLVDAAILFLLCGRLLQEHPGMNSRIALGALAAFSAFAVASLPLPLWWRAIYAAVVIVGVFWLGWSRLLSQGERHVLLRAFRRGSAPEPVME